MCYEYWRDEMKLSEEDRARKRAQDIIDKARNAEPAPKADEPASAEREKETVPA